VQLYRYFVSQSSEFCRRNTLCCFSTSACCCCCCCLFRYRLSPETFGYTLVRGKWNESRKKRSVVVWWKVTKLFSMKSSSRLANFSSLCYWLKYTIRTKYKVTTNNVNVYINLLVRIAHILWRVPKSQMHRPFYPFIRCLAPCYLTYTSIPPIRLHGVVLS
jgi:hypothetical protein